MRSLKTEQHAHLISLTDPQIHASGKNNEITIRKRHLSTFSGRSHTFADDLSFHFIPKSTSIQY